MSRPSAVPPARFCAALKTQPQFLLRMASVRLAGRAQAHLAQHPLRRPVEQHDKRIGRAVEPQQRIGDPERRRQRLLNGQPFGRLFPRADVQEGDRRKADDERQQFPHFRRFQTQQAEDRSQEDNKDRFADPSQAKAGQRDAQLRRAQKRVEPLQNEVGNLRAPMPSMHERTQLRVAHLDQRKFGRDKEAIEHDEHHHAQDVQGNGDEGGPVHVTGSPPRRSPSARPAG